MHSSQNQALAAFSLRKRFNALVVLDYVDFSLSRGEVVGIVGPNGAGKTTLLNVLSGALTPNSGSVSMGGQDITQTDAAERSRMGLGRTHQIPQPFNGMTVFENVFVGASNRPHFDRTHAYEVCTHALELCGMLRVANRPVETLGLLDRKRLELARALATEPSVLLLDEIGGGLTDAEADELVETILVLKRDGISIIWIEHIVHILLKVSDRLICMDAGKIIADGDPQSVLDNPVVFEAYLGGNPV